MKRLRILPILALIVLTLGLAACDNADENPTAPTPPAPAPPPPPPPTPSPTTAEFRGTVSNIIGARIAGATVTALDGPNAGQSATTNAGGDFFFPSLTIANTNFRANSGGYLEVREGTLVNGTNTLNFVFTQARLTGTVIDQEDHGLEGVLVTLVDGPNAGQSVMTNSSGNYTFSALPVGNVNALANKHGYTDEAKGTFVNGTNVMNFRLLQIPGMSEEEESEGSSQAITINASVVGATEWRFEAITSASDICKTCYKWNFGDGNGASQTYSTEQHLYRQTGTFTVTVEAERDNGSILTGSIEIEVRN